MKKEHVLAEIDVTLDKLIENATVANNAVLQEHEMEALQKTQESLLSKLLSMNELVILPKKENLQQKVKTFQKLNSKFMNRVNSAFGVKRKKIPYTRSKKKFLKTN